MEIFSNTNLVNIINTVGLLGIFGIVFAESGLLIGFFLPGDSLLFTAGILASQNLINIYLLLIVTFIAAVIGDNVGYAFGKKVGPKIFSREDSWLFHKENLNKAYGFYQKYGPLTIVLSRFTPIVRTFAPIVAGAGQMDYKVFFFYNIAGGLAWTLLLTLSGFFLGKIIPNIDKYLLPIVAIIVVGSLIPSVYHIIKERMKQKNVK